jgi:hypothetical protein
MRKLPLPPSGPIVTHDADNVCEIDYTHEIPRAKARIDGRDQANKAARNCNLLASKTFNNYNLMGAMRCP